MARAARIGFWFALAVLLGSLAAIPILHLVVYPNEEIPDAVATWGGTILALSLLVTIGLGTIRGRGTRERETRTIAEELDLREVGSYGFQPGSAFGMSVLEAPPEVPPTVLSGSFRGMDVTAFSYLGTRTRSHGKAASILRELLPYVWSSPGQVLYSCAVAELPVSAPHLLAERVGWLLQLRRWIGPRDTGLGDPRFDRAFHVTCEDQRFAGALLDRTVREWLIEHPVSIEISGPWLMCFGYLAWPRSLADLLDSLEGVVRRIPMSAWWPYQAGSGGSDARV